MKKLSFIVMACLMVLGLAQCKKNEPTNNNNAGNADRVNITLTLDNGGQRVHPEEENGLANVVYDNGDVVYVGSNGKYMGYLTYNGSVFAGSINAAATEGQPLQFIFMGGQTIDGLTENSSNECVFNIGDQSNGLAVISCAPSNEDFSLTKLDYTAYLRNQCALVKFALGEVSTDAAITLTGLKTEATINFNGTVTNGTATGDIATYGTGSTRYAVVLSDQAAVTEGAISAEGYTGTFSIPTAYTNAFLTNATMTLTAAAATIITLTPSEIGDIFEGESNTIDGITITTRDAEDEGSAFLVYPEGGEMYFHEADFTFSSSVGKISKIEINYTGNVDVFGEPYFNPGSWEFENSTGKITLSGVPTYSVVWSYYETEISGIQSIVFTLSN